MKIKNTLLLGVFLGLLGPTAGIAIFYMVNYVNTTFIEFLTLSFEGKFLGPLLSLSAIINLGIFYIFIHLEHYLSARGVILSTLLYGVVIVLLKFIW
jgi:hypothetical protein